MNEMIKDFKQLKQSKPAVVHAAAIKVSNLVIRRLKRKYDLDPTPRMTVFKDTFVDKNVPGYVAMTFRIGIPEADAGNVDDVFYIGEETVYFTMEDYRDYSNAAMLLQYAEENELPF